MWRILCKNTAGNIDKIDLSNLCAFYSKMLVTSLQQKCKVLCLVQTISDVPADPLFATISLFTTTRKMIKLRPLKAKFGQTTFMPFHNSSFSHHPWTVVQWSPQITYLPRRNLISTSFGHCLKISRCQMVQGCFVSMFPHTQGNTDTTAGSIKQPRCDWLWSINIGAAVDSNHWCRHISRHASRSAWMYKRVCCQQFYVKVSMLPHINLCRKKLSGGMLL